MNKEDIIRLAEEAGLEPRLWNHTDAFERFAALVAEHEREECAKIFDGAPRLVPSLQFPDGHCFVCGINSEKIVAAIRSRT